MSLVFFVLCVLCYWILRYVPAASDMIRCARLCISDSIHVFRIKMCVSEVAWSRGRCTCCFVNDTSTTEIETRALCDVVRVRWGVADGAWMRVRRGWCLAAGW